MEEIDKSVMITEQQQVVAMPDALPEAVEVAAEAKRAEAEPDEVNADMAQPEAVKPEPQIVPQQAPEPPVAPQADEPRPEVQMPVPEKPPVAYTLFGESEPQAMSNGTALALAGLALFLLLMSGKKAA